MLEALNQENFNTLVLKSNRLVLVDYWSPTCGPCVLYNQVLETLAPEFRDQVEFYKLNVDEEITLANQEGILVMPTTKIYHQGECVKELLGVQTPKELKSVLESLSQN